MISYSTCGLIVLKHDENLHNRASHNSEKRRSRDNCTETAQRKLIACTNITNSVSSLFRWRRKIERAEEYLLLMKSRLDLFEKLCARVKTLRTYELPEIIALPIVQGFGACVE